MNNLFFGTENKTKRTQPIIFTTLLQPLTQNEKEMLSIRCNFKASPLNNLNTGTLSHHILKCSFSDLGVAGFMFSTDCTAFTKALCVSLSTHPDIELQNTHFCCLDLSAEYGGKVLFQISFLFA